MATYPKMPLCGNLNASFSTKSAGGHAVASVITRRQSDFFHAAQRLRSFKIKVKIKRGLDDLFAIGQWPPCPGAAVPLPLSNVGNSMVAAQALDQGC